MSRKPYSVICKDKSCLVEVDSKTVDFDSFEVSEVTPCEKFYDQSDVLDSVSARSPIYKFLEMFKH